MIEFLKKVWEFLGDMAYAFFVPSNYDPDEADAVAYYLESQGEEDFWL